jgi:hypothetical protein
MENKIKGSLNRKVEKIKVVSNTHNFFVILPHSSQIWLKGLLSPFPHLKELPFKGQIQPKRS